MTPEECCSLLRTVLSSDVHLKVRKPPSYISNLLLHPEEDSIILVYKEGTSVGNYRQSKVCQSAVDISGIEESLADLSVTGQPLECPFGNEDDALDDTVMQDPTVITEESFHTPLSMTDARKVLTSVFLRIGDKLPLPVWVLSDMSDHLKQFLLSAEVKSGWKKRTWAVAHSNQSEKIAVTEMCNDFQKRFNITSEYKVTSEVCCVFSLDDYPGMPKKSKCYLDAIWKKPSYEVPINQANTTLVVECVLGQEESQISHWWDQLNQLHKYMELIRKWKQNQVVQVSYHRDGMELPSFKYDREGDVKKVPMTERVAELLRSSDSMSVCRQLENQVNLTSLLNSTIHELLTEKQKGKDFIDRLWSLLIEAETYQELKESLHLVIREIRKQSVKPYIFAKNRSRMASLLRSSSDVEFMVEPLELLVEMGLEKLKRDYMFMFLASNIASTENLNVPKLPSFSELASVNWQAAVDKWLTWLAQLHTVLELVSVIHTTMNTSVIMQFTTHALSQFVSSSSPVKSFPYILENRCYQLRAPVISKEVKSFIEGDKIFYKWMLKLNAESRNRRASSTYVFLEQSPLPQQISLFVEDKSLNESGIPCDTMINGSLNATKFQTQKYTYIQLFSIADKIGSLSSRA